MLSVELSVVRGEASTVHLQNIRHREILAMGREYLEIRLG